MRTLILGQARSGTTAVFLQHAATLPPTTRCLFEPSTVPDDWDTPQHPTLVKSLVDTLPSGQRQPYAAFLDAERVVCVLRDPRDRLVSLLLFALTWGTPACPPLDPHGAAWAHLWRILEAKVVTPQALPFAGLWVLMARLRFDLTAEAAWAWLAREQAAWLAVLAFVPRATWVHYETLAPVAPQPPYRALARAGWAGAWRHWFTPADEAIFRPLLAETLRITGYADDWALAPAPELYGRAMQHYLMSRLLLTWRGLHVPTP